jgi:hypothetical protein
VFIIKDKLAFRLCEETAFSVLTWLLKMKFAADMGINNSQVREVTGHVSSLASTTNITVSVRSRHFYLART